MADQLEVRDRTEAALRAAMAQVDHLLHQVEAAGRHAHGVRERVAHANALDRVEHANRELDAAALQLTMDVTELRHAL